ncbi:MAG: T9SS type A sorting domain-containing protein [Bacteroidetes bacterium]|jgi:PKD repeat protein|nr:T9SS type A sorting domain-containing protein [Bacteroidota bacterium]MBT7144806.1 T9SS type A sorting domain-containing protein [Bacteroidota bacterium]MBT7492397.1 T9SS type A sorting domain-containing protein [Bacteroidota bacterium]
MRTKVLIALLILTSIYKLSYSKEVNISIAKKVAENIFYERFPSSINKLSHKIIAAEYTEFESTIPLYYIFDISNENGFIIISADDYVQPILGYSFEGNFDFSKNSMPPALIDFLENYKSQILYVKSNKILPDGKIKAEWAFYKTTFDNNFKNTKSVSPLVSTNWDQDCYYNADCPIDANAPWYLCGRVYVGCVATAMGQIMKYHDYPQNGAGSHTYNAGTYGSLTSNFGNATYNWGNMPNIVNSSNSDVAQLLYHCAVSVDMDFGIDGSGAYTSDARNSLVNYFNYSSSADMKNKNQYTTNQWINLLKDQLDNSKPMLYRGDGPSGGHAFVCDGYNGSNYFHFNWGWSGSYDGYFSVSNLNPGTSTFNQNHGAVIDITPAATIPVADFEADVTTILVGESVNFYDLSYGVPSSFTWIFSGGIPNSSSLPNPGNIVYNTIGNYNVSLTATNYLGTDTETKVEYIHVVAGFPDLVVQSFSISPQVIPPDSSIVSTGAIFNMSSYIAPQSVLNYYISLDTNFNPIVDFHFHSENVPQLSAFSYFPFTHTVPMPYLSTMGTYYMFCVIDGDNYVVETNDDNNEFFQAVTVALPDLVIQNSELDPVEVIPGEEIIASCTFKNVGNSTAEANNIKFFLSENSIYESFDILIGTENVDSIQAQEEIIINKSLIIPQNTAIGNWKIIFYADHDEAVYESNESNNYSFVQFTVEPPLPDLQIINPNSSSDTIFAGETIELSFDLINSGTILSESSLIKYYLSEDSIIDSGTDVFLASQTVDSISIGNTILVDTSVMIPGNMDIGSWVIILLADATEQIQEENEDNNTQFLEIEIVSSFPDLSVQNIFVSSSNIPAGSDVSVNCEILNSGFNFAEASILKYYLSKTETLDSDSILLSSDEVFSLVSTATSYESAEIHIPYSTQPDDYFLLFYADANYQILESNENNNIESYQITVEEASTILFHENENISCFPNPSNGIFEIELKSGSNFEIEVSDIIGNSIFRKSIIDDSNSNTKIDISNKSKGIYLLSVKSENFHIVQKIIIH